ncbi:putative cytokinin riboside 5'-monophosphate phosphoribohydrolase [Capsulimonas corticalis]|uniref:Cytokinin riboside 5'-monophosphate phosphoribohydrolase n=1 Tax=Capsulimonas corticalis TaxID=2219043 RepID=A0A402CTY5_9BACT|nr:TIGR00730 family Rossman fold protein [Capsulimonas corticalis]BDI28778.1 putative cytokinin riboside 5'-monophosphate phosphoribohydrolase [Capsulimonas corticalis]
MNSICVFCGSNEGARPEYRQAATALGRLLARRGQTLVYGGADVGLMGAVADAALAEGGRVVGVIPHSLVAKEIAHKGLTELHTVGTLHERKVMMAEMSDAFISLPGGYGTLDEMFEMLTWSQIGTHLKPSGLLNIARYFDPLLALLDHAVAERFLHAKHRAMLLTDADPARLLDLLAANPPGHYDKWIDRKPGAE